MSKFTSLKPKGLGIAAILSGVAGVLTAFLDGDPTTNVDWTATLAAISAGWGLLFARENKVTSEEVLKKT